MQNEHVSQQEPANHMIELDMLHQPDDTTCGPTCLHAVYRYYDDDISLRQVIKTSPRLKNGGTLGVMLACHALQRGYKVTIYTYNLMVFDPTWFTIGKNLDDCLSRQAQVKPGRKLQIATSYYRQFMRLGGRIKLEDLRPSLIRRTLQRGVPILTGLSSTFLYRSMREFGPTCIDDDIRGVPAGHFVVLRGYSAATRTVNVADPLGSNPFSRDLVYDIRIDRLIGSILLGILTYDANLVIIEPLRSKTHGS